MASGRIGGSMVATEVARLFGRGGTASAQGEGALLDRFRRDHDPAAFEALVERHGPMVLGVCRRALPRSADAEDAFQATFLVLARRAGTLRDADRLGPWLHGVARRVAARARARVATHHAREQPAPDHAEPTTPPEASSRIEATELRATLDDELDRLPEKLRAPLVLCYLEGLTHDEAAARLGWPVGTVRSRLAGGRDRLRARLTRRGFAPASAGLPQLIPTATVPPTLASATTQVALTSVAAGAGVPASVAVLAQGVISAMFWKKLTVVAAASLVASASLGGAGVLARSGDGPDSTQEPATAPKTVVPPREDTTKLAIPSDSTDPILLMESRPLPPGTTSRILNMDGRPVGVKPDDPVLPDNAQLPTFDGVRKQLTEAQKRIRELEAQLAAARGEAPKPPQPPQPPATPNGMGMRGSGMTKASVDGMGSMRMMGGVGEMGMPGGPSGERGMRSGVIVGPGGMRGRTTPGEPLVMDLAGNKILTISSNHERISIHDLDSGTKEEHRLPDGVTSVVPIVGPGVGIVTMEGPKVDQMLVITLDDGKLHPVTLREPATSRLQPIVGPDRVTCQVGHFLYIFRTSAKRWNVIDLD